MTATTRPHPTPPARPVAGRIAYTQPSITEREVDYVTDAARDGWGPRCYDYIQRFEQGFREHLGCDYAIATSSCTGALHMGLAALRIGPGDEVILADINWIATAAPVVHLGATPVPVDILPDSWCIDPDAAQAAITPRTRAVIATHIYGNLCDMDRLVALCDRYGLALIEDAAEAIGSRWHDRAVGTLGRFGTFSFHGTKTLTTGEGGMFVTNDADLHETVLTLSNHGRANGQARQFWPDMIGFKYKMSNLSAALGCAQLERIDALVDARRAVFAAYAERLADLPLAMNPEPPATRNGYWMPTVVFAPGTGVTRETLQAAFAAADIDARVFFWPLTALGLIDARDPTPVAYDISGRAFNLPSHPDLTEAEIDRVVAVVTGVLQHARPLRRPV